MSVRLRIKMINDPLKDRWTEFFDDRVQMFLDVLMTDIFDLKISFKDRIIRVFGTPYSFQKIPNDLRRFLHFYLLSIYHSGKENSIIMDDLSTGPPNV